MWYEIDIRKLFYIEIFLMKKIIVLIFILVWFVGLGFAGNPTTNCSNDRDCKDNESNRDCEWGYCVNYDISKWCSDNNWIVTWNAGQCSCKISWMTQNCTDIFTSDEMCTEYEWTILKDWSCCSPPWLPYDKATFWSIMTKCCDWLLYDNGKQCCEKWKTILSDGSKESCISCDVIAKEDADKLDDNKKNNCLLSSCDDSKKYQLENWFTVCCPWMVVNDTKNPWQKTCIINTEWNLGINMNSGCLINWQCSYNIYKTLGIRKSDQNPQVKTFVQDIVLAVTMFLGTVIALILITSWILYILAAILWKSSLADMAKKGIINSILWLVLVTGSYALVRLIQFVATAWGW